MSKFFITMVCPVCSDSGFTWIEDNADECVHDGDHWTCDTCHACGTMVAFEDGTMDLIEDEAQPEEKP
jgi:hypothetical protein